MTNPSKVLPESYPLICMDCANNLIMDSMVLIKKFECERLERLNSNVQSCIATYEHNAKIYKENGIVYARYEAEAIAGLLRRLYG